LGGLAIGFNPAGAGFMAFTVCVVPRKTPRHKKEMRELFPIPGPRERRAFLVQLGALMVA